MPAVACHPVPHHRRDERGSALLIVFVFAAIIAIMLYREMPVTVFEAHRQKEQILIDRGHEYVRAIQLFYRRNRGQYPSSFEQLESTNNIRYLRRRYTDPFTGKADWRLLHAGPGGLLIDSKLPQQPIPGATGQPGQPGSLGQSSSTGAFGAQNSNSTSSFGSDSSSSDDASVVVAPVPQRPPAIAANGGPGTGGSQTPSSQALDQNPDAPLLPPNTTDTAQANSGSDGSGLPPTGRNSAAGSGSANQNGGIMQTLNPVIGSATTPQQSGSGGSQFNSAGSMGQMAGGGALAGIASKAKGRTIKVINEQDDYSLWEFFYNPATDKTGQINLNSQAPATGQTGAPGFGSSNATSANSPSTGTDTTTTAPNSTSGSSSDTTSTPANPQPQ